LGRRESGIINIVWAGVRGIAFERGFAIGGGGLVLVLVGLGDGGIGSESEVFGAPWWRHYRDIEFISWFFDGLRDEALFYTCISCECAVEIWAICAAKCGV
jgi:hypothetical protein